MEDLIKVVSVSLGSSRRNMEAEVHLQGKRVLVQRVGTDGDMQRAEDMIRELDGKVDAFGLGGIDLYIWAGDRRYVFRDAQRLARAARLTPVVDGRERPEKHPRTLGHPASASGGRHSTSRQEGPDGLRS